MNSVFLLKKECCIYFNSDNRKNNRNNINFTSINFLNNEGVINHNINISEYNETPGKIDNNNINIKLNNIDNNVSKSQIRDFNNLSNLNNYIKDYYAPSPIIDNNQNHNININIEKNNTNNFNIIKNNYHQAQNQNEFKIINFNDKFDFEISPHKENEDEKNNDSLEKNLNNLDSIDLIDNMSNRLYEDQILDRIEDKKRGKVMDRIVKGRARLNDNNKNKNDLKSSYIMEKSKLYEKVLGNNENIYNNSNNNMQF